MRTREYEAMFLLDNAAAVADFEGTAGVVDQILEKNGATILEKSKWDERKLAYEIGGHKRATYYLVYFRAPPTAVSGIRGDANLAEKIVRHLVIALDEPYADHIRLRREEAERLAEESRKASLAAGWGEGGERRRRRDDEEGDEVPDLVAPDVADDA
jgi:small subunit ribosomal protein S6